MGRFYVVNTGITGKNNFTELVAIYMALRIAAHLQLSRIILVSDSQLAEEWIMKGARCNEPHLIPLVEAILSLKHRIAEFQHIKGHGKDPQHIGVAGNLACDKACREAAAGNTAAYRVVDFKKLWRGPATVLQTA